MVHEPGRTCDHNMRVDEGEVYGQIPRIFRPRERKEELFKMVQKEDEDLEDFVERL